MFKNSILSLCLILAFTACKDGNNKTVEEDERQAASAQFDSLLENYYEDGLRLNPISATTAGDMRYNDQFPDFLSPAYEDSLRNYYTNYKLAALEIDDSSLSESEKMSKDILLWE